MEKQTAATRTLIQDTPEEKALRARFLAWVQAQPGCNDLMLEVRTGNGFADPVVEFTWQAVRSFTLTG